MNFFFTLVCHITLLVSTYLEANGIKFLSIYFLLKRGIKYDYRRSLLDINIKYVGGIGTLSRKGKMRKKVDSGILTVASSGPWRGQEAG